MESGRPVLDINLVIINFDMQCWKINLMSLITDIFFFLPSLLNEINENRSYIE